MCNGEETAWERGWRYFVGGGGQEKEEMGEGENERDSQRKKQTKILKQAGRLGYQTDSMETWKGKHVELSEPIQARSDKSNK